MQQGQGADYLLSSYTLLDFLHSSSPKLRSFNGICITLYNTIFTLWSLALPIGGNLIQ